MEKVAACLGWLAQCTDTKPNIYNSNKGILAIQQDISLDAYTIAWNCRLCRGFKESTENSVSAVFHTKCKRSIVCVQDSQFIYYVTNCQDESHFMSVFFLRLEDKNSVDTCYQMPISVNFHLFSLMSVFRPVIILQDPPLCEKIRKTYKWMSKLYGSICVK